MRTGAAWGLAILGAAMAQGCGAAPVPPPPSMTGSGQGAERVADPGMSKAEAEFRRRTMGCTIEPLGGYVGQVLTPPLQEEIVAASMAGSVRVLGGGQTTMSMAGEPGRLTITLDGNSRIVAFGCE
ncbi:MAG: hypothetical protein K5799_02470 [Erythrobacter sp.]|nr:hypothetical protein [Erythrobacter sp.]